MWAGDMLICRGNRQFGLRNVIDVMFTCALLHGSSRLAANLKMSDVSGDSYHQLNSIFCCVRSESKKNPALVGGAGLNHRLHA